MSSLWLFPKSKLKQYYMHCVHIWWIKMSFECCLSNNIPFYHMNSNLRKSFYNFRLSKFVQKIMLTSFPTIEIAWKNGPGLLTVSGVFSSKYSSLYRIWQILGMKYQQGPLVFPLKETLTSFEFRYWIKFLHFF